MTKRLLDILLSGLVLVLACPVLLGVALAVRINLGAPVFFRQTRPGLRAKPFTMYKFRTMRHAEPGKEAPEFDCERLTGLGRFLRRSSLDELPELLNVLKGDMSLVGPRPLLMQYLDRYTPTQARRMEVRPGVTGLAQVNGRNALSWEERFELDVWYVDHRSLGLDLSILWRTLAGVFSGRGVCQPGQATMTEFMGTKEIMGSAHEPGKSDANPRDNREEQ